MKEKERLLSKWESMKKSWMMKLWILLISWEPRVTCSNIRKSNWQRWRRRSNLRKITLLSLTLNWPKEKLFQSIQSRESIWNRKIMNKCEQVLAQSTWMALQKRRLQQLQQQRLKTRRIHLRWRKSHIIMSCTIKGKDKLIRLTRPKKTMSSKDKVKSALLLLNLWLNLDKWGSEKNRDLGNRLAPCSSYQLVNNLHKKMRNALCQLQRGKDKNNTSRKIWRGCKELERKRDARMQCSKEESHRSSNSLQLINWLIKILKS